MSSKWTLIDILNTSVEYLNNKGFENPRLDAERLLCHALNLNRVELYVNFERPLKAEEISGYKKLLKRRINSEPLQYITGVTEFMSLNFNVNSSVLIPRPETEILVEKIIEKYKDRESVSILDIGTGSGNIAISLTKFLRDVSAVCVDISEEALATAKSNAELNGVEDRLSFVQANVTKPDFSEQFKQQFDALISNPPYISRAEMSDLPNEIKNYEPHSALDGGEDGLDYYRIIAEKAGEMLKQDGLAAMEIGQSQREEVVSILDNNRFETIETFTDLNGRDRVVIGKKA